MHNFTKLSLRTKLLLSGVLGVLLIIGGFMVFRSGNQAEGVLSDVSIRAVSVASVGSLSATKVTLPIIGTVRSESEANLRTEKSGEVTSVYYTVGDTVRAGAVLAEIENASERAGVAQAQAGVLQAQAQYDKLTKGVRDEQLSILTISRNSARDSLLNTEVSGNTSIQSAYATVDDAITSVADSMFSNPRSDKPVFTVTTSNSQLAIDLVSGRTKIEGMLKRQSAVQSGLTGSALETELKLAEADLRYIKTFFDTLNEALNRAVANSTVSEAEIVAYRASAAGARSSVIGAISSITGASDNLNTRKAALEIAEKNLAQGITGGQSEDVRSASAGLAQAEAALAFARANYEKSVIRTPISGTLNTLSLTKGDFVNAFQNAATVSNNGALQVVAYVSEREKNSIVVGAKAMIEGTISGVVTSVAPGLDLDTKKVEVKIGVTDPDARLTQGASVRVDVERQNQSTSVSESTDTSTILVPLTAVKIGATETLVFTVNAENRLESHVVTLGSVIGGMVTITSGVTPEMVIVTDARGLKAGDTVETTEASLN